MFSKVNILSRLISGELDYKQHEIESCFVDVGIDKGSIPIEFDPSLCRIFLVIPSSQKIDFDNFGYDSFLVVEDDGFDSHNSATSFVKKLKDIIIKYNDENHFVRVGLRLKNNRVVVLCVKSPDIDTVNKVLFSNAFQQKLIIIGPFYSHDNLNDNAITKHDVTND